MPTGLTATSGSNAFVKLNWNASAGATAYNVKRSATSTGYFTTIATVSGITSYTNSSGLTNGLTYYYKAAAVGSSGPSSDSAAASATPAGPPLILGVTAVSLATYYNRAGIYTDGRTFSGGLDGSGSAYSANLLGTALFWNNLVFSFGPTNALDVVSCASQTITLPAGQFNTLQILVTGMQGNQTAQTFTVTYTDNSTATFTQSFSDWANQQSYSGESKLITMPYRDLSGGTSQSLNVSVDGYVLVLDQTKTVKNIILPNNANLILMSMMLANDPVSASLATYYNRAGIYTDGTTFTNPPAGGIDGGGYTYSGTLLGGSQTWTNTIFNFGPLNATNVISGANQTIPLPSGNYSRLQMLATAVNGNQASQSFVVTYSDASTTTFVQGVSDWFSPQNYSGESKAIPMGYRNSSDGSSSENNALYLYGYNFALNPAKTVQSVRLPNNANVIVTAISVVPNWQPTFVASAFILTNANAGQNYSGNIATNASDLNKDALTFAKVNGPAWLNVAANGALSGTPANSDANTNTFVVSVKDTGGLSNTATLFIYVNGAPSFTVNPFSTANGTVSQNYSGTIATNATDPNPADTLTFAKVSGPAWLTVGSNGTLSGTPAISDVNTNTFVVSVKDTGGLSNTATLYIYVNGAPSFTANPFSTTNGTVGQNYSGTIATNATDPNPGDVLTFAKVSGPAWLNVAADGTLSGIPANTDANTNLFVVSVTDTGGLSNTATLYIYVNGAPSFLASPFAMPAIVAGQSYSGTIATNATDPNPGDMLTFAKVSGPAWLSVATDGLLSGTPLSGDVGNNSFVASATDPGGLSNTATMNITVTAAPPIISTISVQTGGLLLSWSSGIPPYQVQATTNLLDSNWQNVGGTISSNSLSVTPTNDAMFYRIVGQ